MELREDRFTMTLDGNKISITGTMEKSDYASVTGFLEQAEAAIDGKEIMIDLKTLDFIFHTAHAAHEDDRYIPERGALFKTFADLVTVHIRHANIQQDQIWYLL